MKFKICKNEKAIASNLEKLKKEKYNYLIFTRTSLMELSVEKSFSLPCEKMLGDGQVAIRYKMRSRAISQ